MGISTLCAMFALHQMLFRENFKVLVIATKTDVARNLIKKVQVMYDNLPSWLKNLANIANNNKLQLQFTNGSEIKAVSSKPDSARSEAISLLILDEAAHMPDATEIWTSAQSTLATGGNAIILSTPNGVGNLFHQLWQKAEQGSNDGIGRMNPIKLKWDLHPDRDQTWRDAQEQLLGRLAAAQECFTGETLIYTINGFRRIDSIQIGDKVLTHTGKFKSVVKLFKKQSSDLFKITTHLNNNEIFVTGNHPLMIKDKGWVSVSNINEDDYVATFSAKPILEKSIISRIDLYELITPKFFKKILVDVDKFYINDRKHKRVHNRFLDVGYEFGRMVGLYLAEGSGQRLSRTYSFNYNVELNTWVSKLHDDIQTLFGIENFQIRCLEKSSGQFVICSEIFSKTLDLFINGSDCYTKHLSDFAWNNMNAEFASGIIDGYFLGDGMLDSRYTTSCCSKSTKLIDDIQYILNVLGYSYSKRRIISIDKIPPATFRNTTYYSKYPTHTLSIYNTSGKLDNESKISELLPENVVKNRRNEIVIDDDYIYSKLTIESVDRVDDVYNLEVEDDHTYITSHFICHNCDGDFNTSGHTVIEADDLQWQRERIEEPIEKRGINQELWIWNRPDYTKTYVTTADVSRGDGEDFSSFSVREAETMEKVVEYQGLIDTTAYAHLLISISTEYNNALLVVDNKNVGWSTVEIIANSGYSNLYYSFKNDPYLDQNIHLIKQYDLKNREDCVPGFTTTHILRPVLINKLYNYMKERSFPIKSIRLLGELEVFVWLNGKAQAQRGYNDDLVMEFCIFLFVRDHALRLKQMGIELDKKALGSITKAVYTNKEKTHPSFQHQHGTYTEDLRYLM